VRALDPRRGERGLEQVVGAEGHEPVLLHASLPADHPGHGLAEVVEAHPGEHAAHELETAGDPVEQGGLGLGRIGHMQGARGELRAHADHLRLLKPPGEGEVSLVEVDLALGAGRVVLGDERLRTEPELSAALGHVAADRGLGGGAPELVCKPLPDPPGRVTLLAWGSPVGEQDPVDEGPGLVGQHGMGP